jgi:hypothetical protein
MNCLPLYVCMYAYQRSHATSDVQYHSYGLDHSVYYVIFKNAN